MVFGKDQIGVTKPRIYEDAEEMQKKIDEYFDFCDSKKETFIDSRGNEKTIQKPYTVSGLCIYLGISKQAMSEYNKRSEFKGIIAAARHRVENYCEEHTMEGKLNPIFSIFSLKNNFGWTDRIEVNTNVQPEQLTAGDVKNLLKGKIKDRKDEDAEK